MNHSTPGLPVHHQLPEFTQTHIHTKALTRWTFVGKVISLLLNMLYRLVITFLPRSKCLLISWPQTVQFSSVAHLWPTLCDPMNHSMPGLPIHHQLPEFTQIQVHRVGDAIQPSHPLSSPSSPAPNPAQHQGLLASNFMHSYIACVECRAR